MAAQSVVSRRTIGPIPPRDKTGKLMIPPIMGKRPKLDQLGVPMRDKDGNVLFETGDTRDPREYAAYEQGHEPAEGATKGLTLFQVDLSPEPLALVYAKDEQDAVKVYKREFGITRFTENEPRLTAVEPAAAGAA